MAENVHKKAHILFTDWLNGLARKMWTFAIRIRWSDEWWYVVYSSTPNVIYPFQTFSPELSSRNSTSRCGSISKLAERTNANGVLIWFHLDVFSLVPSQCPPNNRDYAGEKKNRKAANIFSESVGHVVRHILSDLSHEITREYVTSSWPRFSYFVYH